VGCEQHKKYDCSSTAVPSGAGECGSLRQPADSCRDIEAGVFACRPAQDGALSSLLHGNPPSNQGASLHGLRQTCFFGACLSSSFGQVVAVFVEQPVDVVRLGRTSLGSRRTSQPCYCC